MRLLAIDGNSIINRAFYAIKPLTTQDGIFTNAIMGFINIFLNAVKDGDPPYDGVAVAFDLRKPTFRHEKFATYKATRKPMKPELSMQMPYVKDILRALGVPVLECEGFEADDILGTLAKSASGGDKCFILTGDRDALQLINENVRVILATNREQKLYNRFTFEEEYGFAPINLIDYKALAGDASDNIQGVLGIGEKTASKLIAECGTVEKIYENLDELLKIGISAGQITKLQNGEQSARDSKWLATIVQNAPINMDLNTYRYGKIDAEKIMSIFTRLEMVKTFKKLNDFPGFPSDSNIMSVGKSLTNGQMSFDLLENSPLPRPAEPTIETLINLDVLKGKELRFLFDTTANNGFIIVNPLEIIVENTIYKTEDFQLIKDFFAMSEKKLTFGAKPLYHYSFDNCTELKNVVFDAEIAAYLIDPTMAEYSIEKLCARYKIPFFSPIAALPNLCAKLSTLLDENGMRKLFEEVELPLIEILAEMEKAGILIDKRGLQLFGEKLAHKIDGIQQKIYTLAGKEFNISSPKQIGLVLFEDLGLPSRKKTAKSGYSTDASVLEELRGEHPIVDLILEYRRCSKLSSTYVEGLLKTISDDGRIHTRFRQTETRTGRISSVEPNLQNIPVRTPLGSEMRKFFIAEEGKTFVDADYSQIELRILAHISGDKNMVAAFNSNADIHTATAAQVFFIPENMVTKAMRNAAKAVNFGILYGMGAYSLSKDIGVTVAKAKQYIESYLSNYPSVEEFMSDTIDKALRDGYVETLLGRRRPMSELHDTNKVRQAAAQRIARNTPIQGSAADIIKIAMVKVFNRLKKEIPTARLLLQVHDELIVECASADGEKVAAIVQEEMENAYSLKVKLEVDAHVGKNWATAKESAFK